MSLRRLNPPLHLLRAFCTVVRFGGISRAAEALHLTQSAVSKQIQDLERWIGVALFERSRKRLVLTPAGQRYEKEVSALLSRLEEATLELLAGSAGEGVLRLSVLPSISARWLIPRLPLFQRAHPQITLHFVPFVQGYDFSNPELDCSILFGNGHWPGACAQYLLGRDVALIAPRPEWAETVIADPHDLCCCTLLHHVSVPHAWQHWRERHRVAALQAAAGPQFDQFQTIVRAVSVGMGVALVPRCLVQEDIQSGAVVEPLADGGFESDTGYWLCYPESRAHLLTLTHFRDWLLVAASAEGTAATAAPSTAALNDSLTR